MAFDEPEAGRDATNMEEGFESASLLLEEKSKDPSQANETVDASSVSVTSKPSVSLDAPLRDDGFGGTVGEGLLGNFSLKILIYLNSVYYRNKIIKQYKNSVIFVSILC